MLRWTGQAKAEGFGITLHLDSARHEEVDEFSLCGFLGVKRSSHGAAGGGGGGDGDNDVDDDVTLVVPDSPCAIDSLTSDSVQQIALSWGWKVDKRPVPYTELPAFCEVLGAGTAVGLVPIRSITRRGTRQRGRLPPGPRVVLADDDEDAETVLYMPDEQPPGGGGPVFRKLRAHFTALQRGTVPDEFGWRFEVTAKDLEL